jgi:hypothetical protein
MTQRRVPLSPPLRLTSETHRAPCTCVPRPGRQLQPCAACVTWDHKHVLLMDGRTVSQAQWMRLYETKQQLGDASPVQKVSS